LERADRKRCPDAESDVVALRLPLKSARRHLMKRDLAPKRRPRDSRFAGFEKRRIDLDALGSDVESLGDALQQPAFAATDVQNSLAVRDLAILDEAIQLRLAGRILVGVVPFDDGEVVEDVHRWRPMTRA